MSIGINQVQIDSLLSRISLNYPGGGYVSDIVAPVIPVDREEIIYLTWDRNREKEWNAIRAPKAEAAKIEMTLSQVQKTLVEYALAEDISNRVLNNQETGLQIQNQITEFLADALRLKIEIDTAAIAQSTSYVGGNHAASTKWDSATTASDSSIVSDINTAKQAVLAQSRTAATHIVITDQMADAMLADLDVKTYIQYTYGLDVLKSGILPSPFLGLEVVLAASIKDASALGVARSASRVWTDSALVFVSKPNPTIASPVFMSNLTLRSNNWVTKKWNDDARNALVIETSNICKPVSVATPYGYLITGTMT